jgi:hypothetical protein
MTANLTLALKPTLPFDLIFIESKIFTFKLIVFLIDFNAAIFLFYVLSIFNVFNLIFALIFISIFPIRKYRC